ncbi:MAG: hypothetical protein ACPGO3_15780 [Magnetospiraceae bacterium]
MFGALITPIINGWTWWSNLFANIPGGDPFIASFALLLVAVAAGFLAKFANDFANIY